MHTLSDGLSDTAKELGESSATINTGAVRIRAYNDAVIQFAMDGKWKFLIKKNVSLTTIANTNSYSLTGITDMRFPGPIFEVYLGSETTPYLPINWEDRNNEEYKDGKYCYIDPDDSHINFIGTITGGLTITIWYFYLPTRIEDATSASLYPIPSQFRKIIATLAASNIQYSRYLDAQGNRLFNMYEKLLNKVSYQQAERSRGNKKIIKHPLKNFGFRRIYPGGRTR